MDARGDAYEWGYRYLQDRMRSLGCHGWAEGCAGEIDARIRAADAMPGAPLVMAGSQGSD